MRILLDECLDLRFRHLITGHVVETVQYRGWRGKKNGDLLSVAQEHFDVLVTADLGIPDQHYMARFDLALIVLRSDSDDPEVLKDLFERIPEFLAEVAPGKVIVIEPN